MRRGALMAALALCIVLFFLLVAVQLWWVPNVVDAVASTFPEVLPIVSPAIIWGAMAIACLQAILAIVFWRVLRNDRQKIDPASRGWLRAIMGCLVVFLALVVTAFVALNVMSYTTPAVMYGLLLVGIAAAAAGVVLARLVPARVVTLAGKLHVTDLSATSVLPVEGTIESRLPAR